MVIFSRFHVYRALLLQSGFQLFIPLHDKVVLELLTPTGALSVGKPGGGRPKVTHSVTTLHIRQLLSLQYSDDQAAAKSSWTQERPRGPDQAQGEESGSPLSGEEGEPGLGDSVLSRLQTAFRTSCLCCCFC